MRIITAIMILISSIVYGQGITTKTTTKGIGKVGKLSFSLSKSVNIQDTSIILSITQTQDFRMVMIRKNEIDEVSKVLTSFKEETKTKNPSQGTTISHVTKDSVMLTCSYFKAEGWSIMVLNPVFQKAALGANTNYQMNYFVEIKSKQIDEVIKMLTKVVSMDF